MFGGNIIRNARLIISHVSRPKVIGQLPETGTDVVDMLLRLPAHAHAVHEAAHSPLLVEEPRVHRTLMRAASQHVVQRAVAHLLRRLRHLADDILFNAVSII